MQAKSSLARLRSLVDANGLSPVACAARFEEHGDDENANLLGVFSSVKAARAWQDEAVLLPGFRDFPPDCFLIDSYELDPRQWTEGFETLMLRCR